LRAICNHGIIGAKDLVLTRKNADPPIEFHLYGRNAMKKFVCILTAMLLLSLSGCGITTYYWEFQYSVDNVKEIKIIELLNEQIYSEEDYTLLHIIDTADFASVYGDIQNIDYKQPFFTTSPATPYGQSILIVYESGEYEIISRRGPTQYKYSEEYGRIMEYHSYYYCQNEEQYNQMIDKWLDGAETTEGQTE
jgi:hypothetical protein